MKQTVLLHAALFGETGLVQEIWNWGRVKLSAEEIKLFFLNKNDRRQIALHCAAQFGETEVLQNIWQWGAEKLSADQIK